MIKDSYEVGQILFLLMPNKFSIIPSQVVEQLVRTNLDGTNIVYSVNIPGLEEKLELDNFEGKVFKNIDDVRIYMMENAQKSIEDLISQCIKTVGENFAKPHENLNLDGINETENNLIEVDLGNGQTGMVRVGEKISGDEDLKKNSPSPKRKRGRPRKKEV